MSQTSAPVIDSRPAIDGETTSRVALTQAAVELLQKLWDIHGPLMFHQSGGCCDGSAPMCFPYGDFKTGGSDILLGVFDLPAAGADAAGAGETGAAGAGAAGSGETSAGVGTAQAATLGELEFWMSREQFEYWKHTHLTIDVVNGRGAGFSVEAPEGKRFLIRSTLMDA